MIKFDLCLHKAFELLYAVLLAGAGGIVRVFFNQKKYCLKNFVVEIIIASFAGIIMHLLIKEFIFDSKISAALIGIAGFSARELLNMLKNIFILEIKKKI